MTDFFLLNALLAGIGIALMCAPLGCFVVWNRLAYFGDTVAHSALLGVVLALMFKADVTLGMMSVAVLLALFLAAFGKQRTLATDTILGVAAHGALALGLVLLSLSKITIDVNGLLFGDILAVGRDDLWLIYAMAALVILTTVKLWRPLMKLTIHADIAQVEGVQTDKIRLVLMLMLALAIAVSIKLVGILLVTSLLIIPAASARSFARTPTQMAIISAICGILAVAGGLFASLHFDTPSGPSIILASMAVFGLGYFFKSSRA
jgi:zinc transport system permease protein